MEYANKIIKILNEANYKINNLNEKNREELKNYLFDALYNDESLEEIYNLIDEETKKYLDNLVEVIKDDGAFIIKKINQQSPELLIDVFSNVIVVNKIKNVEKKALNIIDKKELNKLANELNDISNFCIINNLSGIDYTNVLMKTYNVSKDVSLIIGELYDQNRMELKLNYIIRKITNK